MYRKHGFQFEKHKLAFEKDGGLDEAFRDEYGGVDGPSCSSRRWLSVRAGSAFGAALHLEDLQRELIADTLVDWV